MRHERTGWLGGIALHMAATTLRARAHDKAGAPLQQTRAATSKLQTLQADVEATFKSDFDSQSISGTIALKRPNLARCESQGAFEGLTVSDGKTVFDYRRARNQYRKLNPGSDGRN